MRVGAPGSAYALGPRCSLPYPGKREEGGSVGGREGDRAEPECRCPAGPFLFLPRGARADAGRTLGLWARGPQKRWPVAGAGGRDWSGEPNGEPQRGGGRAAGGPQASGAGEPAGAERRRGEPRRALRAGTPGGPQPAPSGPEPPPHPSASGSEPAGRRPATTRQRGGGGGPQGRGKGPLGRAGPRSAIRRAGWHADGLS